MFQGATEKTTQTIFNGLNDIGFDMGGAGPAVRTGMSCVKLVKTWDYTTTVPDNTNSTTFPVTFFSGLQKRGLHGIKLMISDAHSGIKAARKLKPSGILSSAHCVNFGILV
jgi:hypothetical protein